MTRIARTIPVLVAALLALLALSAPALAHHKDGHDNGGGKAHSGPQDHDGDADSDSSTTFTEDNDSNDSGTPEGVADAGDNRHPSGKDRSVEAGKSAKNPNQGNAESDPDDDGRGPERTNGGADKPNGTGGVDKADQDGNNGCGNDDDFEDDNEGWCGSKPSVKPETPKPCDADPTMPGVQKCGPGREPEVVTPPGLIPVPPSVLPDVDVDNGVPGDEVLGDVVSDGPGEAPQVARRAALGAALPFTGGSILSLLLAGAATLAAGLATLMVTRRK